MVSGRRRPAGVEAVTIRQGTKTTITSICVFCGSKVGADPAYTEAARRLGILMAGRGVRLVYGGGRIGLMGVLAETVLKRGGEVIGVIPDFLMKYEVENPDVTELIVVGSMHERKRRMFEMSDGFVVLHLLEQAERAPVVPGLHGRYPLLIRAWLGGPA